MSREQIQQVSDTKILGDRLTISFGQLENQLIKYLLMIKNNRIFLKDGRRKQVRGWEKQQEQKLSTLFLQLHKNLKILFTMERV